ncbi:twin-arginine translocase TatA/TatE family subunit [Limnochorda pilosa]|uniref:Sec-independent protein translocase protein TatA n=1 Tax=Limnochorda pilosa TaxID=1555112 RepID=A0A0K2SHF0_LIMPI|nr:twin-arginine translocase TatA/TatE family subunit [Limnochorda pilosa]BAS26239.1 twin-arginine translocation protein TatA [Limnochorda pilosa]
MPRIGPMELVIILALALIIFGPGKLPQVGKALGEGIREFKNSITSRSQDEEERPRQAHQG